MIFRGQLVPSYFQGSLTCNPLRSLPEGTAQPCYHDLNTRECSKRVYLKRYCIFALPGGIYSVIKKVSGFSHEGTVYNDHSRQYGPRANSFDKYS